MPQIYLPLLLLNAIVGTSSNAPPAVPAGFRPESTSVPPTTGEVLAPYVCMPDLSGEPALTGADGLVLLTGTDRPTLNCAYGPVLAGTDEPAFIGTDGPTPTSNSGPVILHQRYQ